MQIEGVGEVSLEVKTHPKKTGSQYQRTLKLWPVLYCPSGLCNILGMSLPENTEIKEISKVTMLRDKQTGGCAGLLDCNRLFRLRLRGQSATHQSLDHENHVYVIRATWPGDERARWEGMQQAQTEHFKGQADHKASGAVTVTEVGNNPPYSQDEKEWIKDNFGDEFHFLRQYGLKIFDEEDRAEGRNTARALMQDSD